MAIQLKQGPLVGRPIREDDRACKAGLVQVNWGAHLTWGELEEVILDVEVTLNNRPLTYVEDDIQLPVLTPNTMIFGQPNLLPEDDVDSMEDGDLRKRARYIWRCKDVLWSRWTGEYIKSLRERHNLNHTNGGLLLKEGDVALI